MTEHMLYLQFKTKAFAFGFIVQTVMILVLVTAKIYRKTVTENSD